MPITAQVVRCDVCHQEYGTKLSSVTESALLDVMCSEGWAVVWSNSHSKKVYCPRCLKSYDPKWRGDNG